MYKILPDRDENFMNWKKTSFQKFAAVNHVAMGQRKISHIGMQNETSFMSVENVFLQHDFRQKTGSSSSCVQCITNA